MDALDRLLGRVKRDAQGWMSVPVYRRIHETARACGGGTFVEVGTFRGAATIALALGGRAAGQPFRVLTADLLRPGVGPAGDTDEARIGALRATFAAFGVDGDIGFVPGTSRDLVAKEDPKRIDLLLLDGGGRVEEDLAILWERLAPGCPVIVDDIDGRTYVHRRGRTALVDQKHRLSRLLAECFAEAGLLVPDGAIEGTGWYRKGAAAASADSIRLMALPAYHELIKVSLGASEFGAMRAAFRAMARRAPRLAGAFRGIWPAR